MACIVQDLSLWHMDSLVWHTNHSCSVACEIPVPQPGIEPASPALEGRFFNYWTTKEVPRWLFQLCISLFLCKVERIEVPTLWSCTEN